MFFSQHCACYQCSVSEIQHSTESGIIFIVTVTVIVTTISCPLRTVSVIVKVAVIIINGLSLRNSTAQNQVLCS